MKKVYPNILGSERTVELEYMYSSLEKRCDTDTKILDVGGIPSNTDQMSKVYELIKNNSLNYKISDFRGGQYKGDFMAYDFGEEKFDVVIFLSSLEHFPQCTEGPDMIYREGEDERGFAKALSLLNEGGLIVLTVPFGKQRWQDYHQNYNWDGILKLTEGSEIQESFVYKLEDSKEEKISSEWVLTDPALTKDLIYTDRAYACGCFLLKKK
tara:strand:+ start:836 stop:1468 length:633 start_codon:yes stop_codon:yes gene_type:complete